MIRFASVFSFLAICLVFAKHEVYEGHAVFKVTVKDVEQTKLVNNLETLLNVDILGHAIPGRPGEVLVAKELKEKFQEILDKVGIEYEIEVENVKELLDLEDELLSKSTKTLNRTRGTPLPYNTIHDYATINDYLEELAATYPDVVTLVLAGTSFHGRPIKYLKISTTNFQDESKPIVYLESLLHAREWITQPATLYAIEKLVIDVQDQDLLRDIDWIIMPVANPDGFEYTREMRLWRKNRADGYMIADICVGVDLNRNFDINWSAHSSGAVCSDTFHGRSAFSEPETAAIKTILEQYSHRMALFLDIHSFGSMILYGYGTGVLPPNGLYLHLVGIQMSTAIDAVKMGYNPNYVVGNVAMVLYEASGSAQDYAQSVGVPLSYTFELPGHRFGVGGAGFLVDPNFIEQAGYETWEGIKAGARYARNMYSKIIV